MKIYSLISYKNYPNNQFFDHTLSQHPPPGFLYPQFHVLMSTLPKIEISQEENIDIGTSSSFKDDGGSLNKFYQLAKLTRSSINSGIYAATGIQLDQKKLVISFIITLVKDFALAYSVRGSLKLIPKLLKMLQILK